MSQSTPVARVWWAALPPEQQYAAAKARLTTDCQTLLGRTMMPSQGEWRSPGFARGATPANHTWQRASGWRGFWSCAVFGVNRAVADRIEAAFAFSMRHAARCSSKVIVAS